MDHAAALDQLERLGQELLRCPNVAHQDPVGPMLPGEAPVVAEERLDHILHVIKGDVIDQVAEGHGVDLAGDHPRCLGMHGERHGEVADAGEHVHDSLASAVEGGHPSLLIHIARGEHHLGDIELVKYAVLLVHRLRPVAEDHLDLMGCDNTPEMPPVSRQTVLAFKALA